MADNDSEWAAGLIDAANGEAPVTVAVRASLLPILAERLSERALRPGELTDLSKLLIDRMNAQDEAGADAD